MNLIKPNVYRYVDYRLFLKDYYETNKAANPAFSHRYFSRLAGLTSYNYLKLIIDGKRRLSNKFFAPFCKGLKLQEDERLYFKYLVEFNHSVCPDDKARRFERLIQLKPNSELHVINGEQFHILKHWYYIPLVELTELKDFSPEPAWAAKKLRLNSKTVSRAYKQLVAKGLLKKVNGTYQKVEEIADTEDEVSQFFVKKYHRDNLNRAAEKVFEQEVHEREFGSITFVASDSQMKNIKEKIKKLRLEIFAMLDKPAEKGAELFQFNNQLFRLTEKETNE